MGYEEDLEKAQQYAERVRQKQELEKIKHANDKEKNPLSFSKIAVIFIFANCLIIEIYSMVIMAIFHDLTSLGSLMMAVLGQCASILGYFIKSGRENTASGIVYETTMMQLQHELGMYDTVEDVTPMPIEIAEKEKIDISMDEDDGAVG